MSIISKRVRTGLAFCAIFVFAACDDESGGSRPSGPTGPSNPSTEATVEVKTVAPASVNWVVTITAGDRVMGEYQVNNSAALAQTITVPQSGSQTCVSVKTSPAGYNVKAGNNTCANLRPGEKMTATVEFTPVPPTSGPTYIAGAYRIDENGKFYLSPAVKESINPANGQIRAFSGTRAFMVGDFNGWARNSGQELTRANANDPLVFDLLAVLQGRADGKYCLGATDADGWYLYIGPIVYENMSPSDMSKYFCMGANGAVAPAVYKLGDKLYPGPNPPN